MPSDPFPDLEKSIDALAARREEMDVTLGDIGEALAEERDLASSTLGTRVGEWERGERAVTEADVGAYHDALRAIHAERTFSYPPCARCGYEGELGCDEIGNETYCLSCGDTIRRDRKRAVMARIRRVLDDVDMESEPVDEHRPLTAFAGGELDE